MRDLHLLPSMAMITTATVIGTTTGIMTVLTIVTVTGILTVTGNSGYDSRAIGTEVSYAKNFLAVHFQLDYANAHGDISNYYPDFLVKLSDSQTSASCPFMTAIYPHPKSL
jgi:hypothetical protein